MSSPDAWTSWPAPAKLNLFLHIVGRRADGYHRLQTVFQILDWGDTVRLRVRDDAIIRREGEIAGVAAENDLCVRAARALRECVPGASGVDIAIGKRIPIGGGLGGGSSDAATTLVALNALWGTALPVDDLAQIGLRLGADVPVFVRGFSAWAEGVGEQLTPIELPGRDYVLVDPGAAVPTAPLFQAAELTRNCAPTTIESFLAGAATSNVFAPVVRARFPAVAQALDWLGRFGDARLSGSGGCIFAAVESAAQADEIVRNCPAPWRAWRARGVNRSPLAAALARFGV
ncbi:MAG TPA: 4-(cytidine 5'-diphospho)-2-C-methyl-D-erythritol kinase, partial [Rudaea sp.]